MSELQITVAEALVLKPGDRVLLITDGRVGWTRGYVDEAQELLRERFPDVEFTFVSGIEQAAVERAS